MGTPKVAGNGDIAFRLNLLGTKSMIIEFEKRLECKSNIGKPSIASRRWMQKELRNQPRHRK